MSSKDQIEKESSGLGFDSWLRRVFSGSDVLAKLFSLFLGSRREETSSPTSCEKSDLGVWGDENTNPIERARWILNQTRQGRGILSIGHLSIGSSFDPEDSVGTIHKFLSIAGVEASALDPEGRKSPAEMEIAIGDAVKQGYFAKTKRLMDSLTSAGPDDPTDIAKEIEANIAKANQFALKNGENPIDLTALDASHSKSSAQMESELGERIVQGYILRARNELEALQNSPFHVSSESDNKTWDLLAKANLAAKQYGLKPVDASALDPEGKQSETTMNKRILKAIEDEHFQEASHILYSMQHSRNGVLDDDARDLKQQLVAANKAAVALGDGPIEKSSLDPNGGKYRLYFEELMKQELDYYNPATQAARELGMLPAEGLPADKESLRIASYSNHVLPLDTPLNIPQSFASKKIK